MGWLDLAGMGAAYQGFQEEQRRQQDDAQRKQMAERQTQEAAFQEEARQQQRKQWARAERMQAEDDADLAQVRADVLASQSAPASQPAAPQTPAQNGQSSAQSSTPEKIVGNAAPGMPKASGMPQALDFNAVLSGQQALLQKRLLRGALSAQEYAQALSSLNKMQSEGIHQALLHMATGDYQAGLDAYNNVGRMRGARLIEGKAGVSKINGQDTPTHFVTIQNADGSRAIMDVALARYQLLDLDRQLQHQDAAAKNQMQREQHKDQLKLGYDKLAADKESSRASLGLQAGHLNLARKKFEAETPAGQIRALEQAWGQKLTPEAIANRLGIDSMPPAIKLQVQSLAKQQEQLAHIIAKGMESGALQPGSDSARALQSQLASTQMGIDKLLGSMPGAQSVLRDPAGLGLPGQEPSSKTGGNVSAPAKPVPPEQEIVHLLGGRNSDKALQALLQSKAQQLLQLGQAYRQADEIFRAVSGSGDIKAIQRASQQLNDIKAQVRSLLPPHAPAAKQVLNVLGM